MINCLIIDDDPVAINLVKHFISNTEGLEFVQAFSNPIEASNYLRSNLEQTDLIFLDVEMPEMSGMELLDSFSVLPPVILITSKEKYAVKAFDHKVIHYLVKPIDYGRFLKAVERVFKKQEADKAVRYDYLFIKENGMLNKILYKDIVYCEALGDYVKVFVKGKPHVVSSTMKNLEDKLKLNKEFMRVHRSYIINLLFLENFDYETAVVAGKVIPIGNKYRPVLQSHVNII